LVQTASVFAILSKNIHLGGMDSTSLSTVLSNTIRDVPDFPKPGILFKDITPILKDHELCQRVVQAICRAFVDQEIAAVAGIESRGFLFGMMIAEQLKVPFVPIRKQGKLPADVISCAYDLEYGSATIEIHADALNKGTRVLIHDDLLATGGTVVAASELVQRAGGEIAGYAFVINLDFLEGKKRLERFGAPVYSLVDF